MLIRKAEREDAYELAILKFLVWTATYWDIYPREKFINYKFEEHAKKFVAAIENEQVYVIDQENRLVGVIIFGNIHHQYSDFKYELQQLMILEKYQVKGFGKMLMQVCTEYFKEKGIKEILINCNKYNTNAQKFYEKIGAKLISTDVDNYDKSIVQCHYSFEIL